MKTITVGFSKSKKSLPIGSWLIRLFQQTPYSHVYLKFHSESLGRVLIYEAVGSGLRFIGPTVWASHAEEVASFDISIDSSEQLKLLQYCVDNAGSDYGYMQNIGIALAKVFSLKSNPFQTGKNCSEIVSEALKLEGYSSPINKNLITPKDVYDMLSKGGGV